MPNTTGQGITYPVSTDTVHLTDDFATLAQSVDTQLASDRGLRDAAWSAYTPAMTGSTSGGTLGNATVETARYCKIGRFVMVVVEFTLGTTSSWGSGACQVSLPVNARTTVAALGPLVGTMFTQDVSTGARYFGSATLDTTSRVAFMNYATGIFMTGTSPYTWAATDIFKMTLQYEAAAA